ncbi:uncharacterized protein MELLADRAFT_91747 [Melampsora larici-populina 98AG31]|uniref:Uncharacterized protein n=1 Tax=Melampsora larici-populina (strain 98AG31 / pathotype 3-4-7) TaxID=747676 RepID=F4S060_MELLP|nr:uncharacterized protein MELLADRAFT_91747 [Melampsora larici-populina 98AG31]EGG01993.1 hypothetical protein MELLADRAFT_91747 [Melampsora larici-populina 98AG31]
MARITRSGAKHKSPPSSQPAPPNPQPPSSQQPQALTTQQAHAPPCPSPDLPSPNCALRPHLPRQTSSSATQRRQPTPSHNGSPPAQSQRSKRSTCRLTQPLASVNNANMSSEESDDRDEDYQGGSSDTEPEESIGVIDNQTGARNDKRQGKHVLSLISTLATTSNERAKRLRIHNPANETERTKDALHFETTMPTIKNYKELVDDWPEYKITAEIRAMMGNVSRYTLNKSIGELGGERGDDAYHLWMSYSKEGGKPKMSHRGQTGVLSNCNKVVGALWTALPLARRRVFHPRIFYALSGLPPPPKPNDHEDDDDEDEDEKSWDELPTQEREELQTLYDKMVSKEKVAKVYAKVAAGVADGETLPEYNCKLLRCIERLHDQIANKSNRMSFSYYLIASSNYAATEGSSSDPGWCREFTSHNDMADYVTTKANFPTIFAAHIQGLSVNEVVAKQTGKKNLVRAKEPSPSDVLKGQLSHRLRLEMKTALKMDVQGFPCGPDPVKRAEDKFSLRVIQLPGSALSTEVLALGFDKMKTSQRRLWLDDVNAGFFKLEKISDGTENNQSEPSQPADDGVNGDLLADVDDTFVDNVEEWGGLEWAGFVDS